VNKEGVHSSLNHSGQEKIDAVLAAQRPAEKRFMKM
jgi:hypothetical protein